MPNAVPRANGEVGARAARLELGLVDLPGTTGFADARYRSNGRRVQIKTASADGGVVRLWREHLEELADHAGSVVVVVVDRDAGDVVELTKVSPSTLIDACDWRETGQESMSGMHEARPSWQKVVSLAA